MLHMSDLTKSDPQRLRDERERLRAKSAAVAKSHSRLQPLDGAIADGENLERIEKRLDELDQQMARGEADNA